MKNSSQSQDITVEIKIFGLVKSEYVNLVIHSRIPLDISLKNMLKFLFKRGDIDKAVFSVIRFLRPPVTLLINGEVPPNWKDHRMQEGDSISIFTPAAGG